MNLKNLFCISLFCLLAGILVCAYFNNWIVIKLPIIHATITQEEPLKLAQKKSINLFYWHNNNWHTEKIELIWTNNQTQNLIYLINSWLTLLDEEAVMDRKIALQTAILSASGQELYLSFDRSPFDKQTTTHAKWFWAEGLLKTIRETGHALQTNPIQLVHFLEQHQPLQDHHLDFTNPWPIMGFIK